MKTGRFPYPPLLTVIRPYVVEDSGRATLRAIAGAFDQASRSDEVGFLASIWFKIGAKMFQSEAGRTGWPGAGLDS